MEKKEKVVHETIDAKEINDLYNSREWCVPRWSEKKGLYIMIRKASSLSG